MCTLCHGIQMRVAFEPDPLWTSVPRCSLPTIHLLEWVPDTHWGGSGDRCHAISHRKHTQSFTQRPHSYRWPITSVLGCWWRLGSPLPCGDKQVGIFHTGRNHERQGSHIAPPCPFEVFGLKKKLELCEGQWQPDQSPDVCECTLRRFGCQDFSSAGKTSRRSSTIAHNVSDLWPKQTRLAGDVS